MSLKCLMLMILVSLSLCENKDTSVLELLEDSPEETNEIDDGISYNINPITGDPSFGSDYWAATQYWEDRVYNEVCAHKCLHGNTATRFSEIATKKRITCGGFTSITMQQAGFVTPGKLVAHTLDTHGKNNIAYYNDKDIHSAIKKAILHRENLHSGTCDIVRVMLRYKDLPDWLKRKGTTYVQDSNICVSAGGNYIYSCNFTGQKYGPGGRDPKQSGGYPKEAHILFAIVPRTNGKSNVPKTSHQHIAC